jgi:hypothetical protein
MSQRHSVYHKSDTDWSGIELLPLAREFEGQMPESIEFISYSLVRETIGVSVCNGPTNSLVCNKTLIQMSHAKSLKITPTCFDHQLIIIRELLILVKITG